MRYRDLYSFMRKGQKILYLYGWKILLKMCSKDSFDEEFEHGNVDIFDDDQEAVIYINKDIKYDQQRSVLHELCHIQVQELQPENPTDEQKKALERVVLRLEKSYSELLGLPPEEATRRAETGGKRSRKGKGA